MVESSKKYVYKDASDQDFTDDGEIDDAADSDFDAGAKAPPKKRSPKKTPSKKSPAKKGKKKTPAKKTPAKKGKKAATNGTTPRYHSLMFFSLVFSVFNSCYCVQLLNVQGKWSRQC